MSATSSFDSSLASHRDTTQPLRCLVTGGAGFIGSHLCKGLLDQGHDVTVIDNLSTGRRINLPEHHPCLRFIQADLAAALPALGKGELFDEIYHLAAAVGVKLIIADPINSIETNITQTSAILRFAHERGGIPILIASSSEVYGKSTKVPFSEEDDVHYGSTTVTRWSYAMSKAVDEYLALAYHQQHALPVAIARFFNTVGPGQVGDYGMVLPRFVQQALNSEPIEVYGDGSQSRCFCDVRDIAAALPVLLRTKSAHGRVFNLGGQTPITIQELAHCIINNVGSSSIIKHIPYTQAYAPGFEDLAIRRPDTSRVRSEINFSQRIGLDQTIADVAAWITAGKGPGVAQWNVKWDVKMEAQR